MTSLRRRFTLALVLVTSTTALAGCTASEVAPSTGTHWTALSESPLSPRRSAVAAWVAGRFVVVGGWSDPMCADTGDCDVSPDALLEDAAALDPATGQWRAAASAPVGVVAASTAVVGDALYILTPDRGDVDAPASLLRFTPDDDTWVSLPLPPGEPMALVAAGDALVAVGYSDEYGTAIDSVLDPTAQTWRALPDDPLGPSFDRQAVWLGDRLLLTAKDLVPSPGSQVPSVVRLAELSGDLSTWGAPRETEVIGWGPVAAGGRVVFPELGSADGGEVNNWGRSYPMGGVYDPADGSWDGLPDIDEPDRPTRLPAIAVGDRVVVGDGLLDPVDGGWEALPDQPWGDLYEQAVASGGGVLFVWGGATAEENVADGYLLRPAGS